MEPDPADHYQGLRDASRCVGSPHEAEEWVRLLPPEPDVPSVPWPGVPLLQRMAMKPEEPRLDGNPPGPGAHGQTARQRPVPNGTPGTTAPVGPGYPRSSLEYWFG